jgi:signal peptidase I
MGKLILRWFLSRTARHAIDMCRQARKLLNSQRDLLPAPAIAEVVTAAEELKRTVVSGESLEAVQTGMKKLEKVANQHVKAYPHPGFRDNVEVLLVTGAIVLALRTFFFQPMAIPSGSAQPTLWGIHHKDLKREPKAEIPNGWRRVLDLCWSGIRYYHVVAENDGTVRRVEEPVRVFPLVKKQTFWIDDTPYALWFVPDDVVRDRARLQVGQRFHKGDDIIKLEVVSGDHLFVDCLTYNFRRPKRGEIIVFSSEGIPGLIPNTHYIKRLVAVGGDGVRIGNDRHLIINGERLDASTSGYENVYGFDPKRPPEKDEYSGHVNNFIGKKYTYDPETGQWQQLAPLFPDGQSEFVVRPRHCLAFGDNTMNSHDGRAWGDFPQEKIVGKAGFVFWPIGRLDSSRFGWGFR